jgi:hypothetical protein
LWIAGVEYRIWLAVARNVKLRDLESLVESMCGLEGCDMAANG